MFEPVQFEGLIAIVFSLSIPIVAIICVFIAAIKKKNSETELRKAIIENHVDPESIKLLVEEPDKKTSNKFTYLRRGSILVGGAIGAMICAYNSIGATEVYFWAYVLGGMGLGMLTAFVIETQMTKNEKPEEDDSEQQ